MDFNHDFKMDFTPQVKGVDKFVTGYKLQKMLKLRGFDRKPQMIYNYIAKGLIKSQNVNGQKLVHIDVANVWIDKFVAKHTAVLEAV